MGELNSIVFQYLAYADYYSYNWYGLTNYNINVINYIDSRIENDIEDEAWLFAVGYTKNIWYINGDYLWKEKYCVC